jgi:hypothetical protein
MLTLQFLTIVCSFAYIEFASKDSVMKAKMHNDSLFKGRQITVIDKRKNKPGMGHGGMRAHNNPMAQMLSVMQMMMKRGGRGGGFHRGGAMGGAHRGGRGGGAAGGPPAGGPPQKPA